MTEPIAIVGLACRFPGDATNPAKLWELLKEPRDVSKIIPKDRFNADGFYHKDSDHHGTTNVRHSYVLDQNIRQFDSSFFGIKPVEAKSIDPQQRLLMEVVFEAMESSGETLAKLSNSDTAVYVGVMSTDYADLMGRDIDDCPTYFATGAARSIVSNRISYFFNWHGPSMTIDTACSSSLVAVHQAVQVLRSGQSKLAVAAGANLLIGPEQYIAESKLKMLSPDGKSQMWDEKANGYARGDGIAAVFLKTLSQAIQDGDHIHGVIRETGVNQDGRTKGITMPSAKAQAALIHDVYRRAGLDLSKHEDRPQYFEAHGTGTSVGDPIEAEAIATAFFGPDSGYKACPKSSDCLFVGSIKTIIGHTEGAAGLAALFKGLLAIQNDAIPPNLLFDKLNPNIEPFYEHLSVPTKALPWPHSISRKTPRRVSLNSFGFGGTNAHAILESYDNSFLSQQNEEGPLVDSTICLSPIVFSAASEKSLSMVLSAYLEYLEQKPTLDLRALADVLMYRRELFGVRKVITGRDVPSLRSKIEHLLLDAQQSPIGVRVSTRLETLQLLGIFTGQGAQWMRMGAALLETSEIARQIMDDLEDSLAQLPTTDRPSWSLVEELLRPAESSRIGRAALSQPLCTALQVLIVELLRIAGITFRTVVGHSSGEIAAAYAAGYMSSRDAIRIAYYRGLYLKYAASPNDVPGAMIAVGTSLEDAEEISNDPKFRGRVSVAACNSSSSITLSGDEDAMDEIAALFEDEKKFARKLRVDKAYHSHHMDPCRDIYIDALRNAGCVVRKPLASDCTWVSSVYAEVIDNVDDDLCSTYWANNMNNTVRFSQALTFAAAKLGPFDAVTEIGPHPALKGPATQTIEETLDEPSPPYISFLGRGKDDLESFSDGLGALWTNFGPSAINFAALNQAISPEYRLSAPLLNLPQYAWDHDREFWHESRRSKAYRENAQPPHQLLGTQCTDNSERQKRWRNVLKPTELPWLIGHQVQGQVVFPAAGYMSSAIEAVVLVAKENSVQMIELTDFVIDSAVTFEDAQSTVETQVVLSDIHHSSGQTELTAEFWFYSASSRERHDMHLNAQAQVRAVLSDAKVHLQPKGLKPKYDLLDVDHELFYTSLSKLGFNYTHPFDALTSLERRLDYATGLIKDPAALAGYDPLLIHPAALDAAIQSIILAYCWPGDTRMRSIHLPTKVERICFDTAQLRIAAGKGLLFEFESCIAAGAGAKIQGDADIFLSEDKPAMVQLEGLQTRPLVVPIAADDLKVFSRFVWEWGHPMLDKDTDDPLDTTETATVAFKLERVAHYYLKRLLELFPPELRRGATWYHQRMFDFAEHMIGLVRSGKHKYGQWIWQNDTEEVIKSIVDTYPESVDFRIMRTVGENLPAVVRGEMTMLEPLTEDNMLNDFYVVGLAVPEYMGQLAKVVKQISHRYPHMNVLEIGAGTGGATKVIIKEVGEAFQSYSYTDISEGFFEKARATFVEQGARMIFKVLNIEEDPIDQGYEVAGYDVIVASLVLHATHNLETTMKNVRKLLKPGGYLILLEITDNEQMRLGTMFGGLQGWWLGCEDGRILSPCVESDAWDDILHKTGFSGIDVEKAAHESIPIPLAVIVAQAIDDRVDALRKPLQAYEAVGHGIEYLTITGGCGLAADVKARLAPFCANIRVFDSLDHLREDDIPFMGSVIVLDDLDHPVFKDMTETRLAGFKTIFQQSRTILWLTSGAKGRNPYANMIVGIGRTLVVEMPHLRLQFADIPVEDDIEPSVVAETYLRHELAGDFEQNKTALPLLWSSEPEIMLSKGGHLVPRLKLDSPSNERYNSSHRVIRQTIDPANSVLELQISETGPRGFKMSRIDTTLHPVEEYHNGIRVQYSTKYPTAFDGHRKQHLRLIFGKHLTTGDDILALSAHSRSVAEVPANCFASFSKGSVNTLEEFNLLKDCFLISTSMMDVPDGSNVVVVNGSPQLRTIFETYYGERRISYSSISIGTQSATGADSVSIPINASARFISKMLPRRLTKVISFSRDNAVNTSLESTIPSTCQFWSIDDTRCTTVTVRPDADGESARLLSLTLEVYSKVKNSITPEATGHWRVSYSPMDASEEAEIIDWTPETPVIEVHVGPAEKHVLFGPHRTYWLVGLTGGLGLSLCNWMVDNGATHLVVSSRNPRIPQEWMNMVHSKGATVKVIPHDVTDRESTQSVLKEIVRAMPPIAGVIQGAMGTFILLILRDTMFHDLDIDRYHKVVQPKVDGSIHLDEIFGNVDLEFMIYLSSTVSITGNPGQSVYAAANAFMVALANQRKQKGLRGSAVNVGAIYGNGYVTRELTMQQQIFLHKLGNMFMAEQDFHTIIAEAVLLGREESNHMPELSTGLRLEYDHDEDKMLWVSNPMFQHLTLGNRTQQSMSSSKASSIAITEQLQIAATPIEVFECISVAFSHKIRTALQIEAERTILDSSADELGIDSLVAVDVRSWFFKELNVDMAVLKILSGASMKDLLLFAQEKIPPNLTPGLGGESGGLSTVPKDLASETTVGKRQPVPSFGTKAAVATTGLARESHPDVIPQEMKSTKDAHTDDPNNLVKNGLHEDNSVTVKKAAQAKITSQPRKQQEPVTAILTSTQSSKVVHDPNLCKPRAANPSRNSRADGPSPGLPHGCGRPRSDMIAHGQASCAESESVETADTSSNAANFGEALKEPQTRPGPKQVGPAGPHESHTLWPETIIHQIEHAARSRPHKAALRFEGVAMDYEGLVSRVQAIASRLTDQQVQPRNVVGVMQDTGFDLICSVLAVMRVGAVYVSLDPAVGSRIQDIVHDCQPAIILHDSANKLRSTIATNAFIVCTTDIRNNSETLIHRPILARASEIAAILYTGGPTGEVRGIELTHANFCHNAELATQQYGFLPGDINMQQSSSSFDMSLSQLFLTLSNAATLVLVPKNSRGDPLAICRLIKEEKITFTQAAPSEYISWIRHGNSESLANAQWRRAVSGGEKVSTDLKSAFRGLSKDVILMDSYGPTEGTFCSHSRNVDCHEDQQQDQFGLEGMRLWPNHSAHILDESHTSVPHGTSGEIYIGGCGVAQGYYKDPTRNSTTFISNSFASEYFKHRGWTQLYKTGDRGFLDQHGHLHLQGRIEDDSQVEFNSQRIDPADVESTLIETD
ncbi:Polyketide synthase-nonribosomal peptide synthetase-like protein [Elsinoe fawcettii]|nr:Polyketide synthase-nonribosomal peptide synthetase-like protein [Elsinoe fawcettii]